MSPAATRRTRRGGGWSYVVDGEAVTSVSTIVREGVPAPQFAEVAAKNVAGYAVDHWAELDVLSTSKRYAQLIAARWAERDAAAGRGTQIHKLAEQLVRGDEVEVPEGLVGHVDACVRFLDDYAVDELYVERAVIYRGTPATTYAGTFDLLACFDGKPDVWLLDWKTGASGIWPDHALQLAAYAHAQTLLDGETEIDLPRIDHAAAVWLRADGYDVVPVDISDATFRTFQYAQQLAAYRAAPREQYVGEMLGARAAARAS